MTIKKVVIVGGGTAGWLAANHLGKALSYNDEVTVSLIESPDIPPIGVGEGTVPQIRKTLSSFGISETEFIRTCDVTFKQSIKFVNWMDKKEHGENNFFHHLFDMPSKFGEDLTAYWLNHNKGKMYGDMVSVQHSACEHNKAPKSITTPEYEGTLGYAYHLNAAKFAKLLAENAINKFSVEHVKATVTDVLLTDNGSIEALMTKELGKLEYDFYIDCTGFESVLLGKALKVPFVEKTTELLVNSALVVQVPTQEDDEIPPYTLATAHQAGWIWDIALTNRRGVGFVYSDNHMSDEEAKRKLDHYLEGNPFKLTYRKIPMKVGHREKFWHKNCVSLGLAQGFLEPLEATSILLTDFAASFLADRFPKSAENIPLLEKRFNHVMGYAWERVIDFVKLHYSLSDREDSQFWLDNKKKDTISDTLTARLDLWQQFSPQKEDFFTKFEVFDYDNYLYLLYGMNYKTDLPVLTANYYKKAEEHFTYAQSIAEQLNQRLPNHRELLNKIKKYGLQGV
ncbi:tryptophan halogenase family protein [Colwellia sp. E2M01]|uniref:tryptophan halogenase family protein n=1 Tax=Colwellia sp. E2M01 TaxID=2841561 RepID=UPI001C07F48B|nr:tryptophan halogenase family protein [Colwellia sp. E2M01]MBU2872027.1 tryptophan 7-halogenase [Colwellia sp. E2M01]